MTRFKHYRSGALYGIRYWFDGTGDCIPAHIHEITHAHNIVVLEGSVMFSTEQHAIPLVAGTVFDFDWTQRHKISALERASVLHLFLNGMPQGYDSLPAHEIEGELKCP
jgi:quercetin dioxygenase-like cupin family protein